MQLLCLLTCLFCSFQVVFCLHAFCFKMGVCCTMYQHPSHFLVFPLIVTLSLLKEVLLSAGFTVEVLIVEKSYLKCGGKGTF